MQYGNLRALVEKFRQARVLVLGDVMLDRFIHGAVERISPESPIPVLSIEKSTEMLGGAGNVANNCAALGGEAILIGVVGEDVDARGLHELVASRSRIKSQLVVDKARPTTLKIRYVSDGQQILRADRESRLLVTAAIEREILDRYAEAVKDVDVIIISDYAKGVLTDSVTRTAISLARAAGKPIIVDPKCNEFEKYSGSTILTPNRSELQITCGKECFSDEQIINCARESLDPGVCEIMVVTRGKDGMSVIRKDGSTTHLRTVAREVFDVSGAGDTVIATMSICLAVGGGVVDACAMANISASIAVGKRGTSTVSRDEIVAALSQLRGDYDEKIFTLESAIHMVRSWKKQNLKIAFTNGCFDLLHPGHISLLNQARQTADRLVVGLNADSSVRRLKGPGRPLQAELDRAIVLASLRSVDAVVIFSEDTPLNLIRLLKPEVLIKGSDYSMEAIAGADVVLEAGGEVILADLVPGQSTTETVRKVISGPHS